LATVRRLGSILGPERLRLVFVMVLAVGGVVLVVIGPRCSVRRPTSSCR
jgi:hypothetical protein